MYEIQYGRRKIRFDISFSKRKTLEISVSPDQSVLVKAPSDKSVEQIIQRVQRRARWIVKQQTYFYSVTNSSPVKEYVSGETFRYLGKQYRLKVISINLNSKEDLPTNECVKMIGGYIQVYTKRKGSSSHVKNLLDQWYRTHAEKKFHERVEVCSQRMKKYGIERPQMEMRIMKNRWGSYTPSGKVLLNPNLIESPTYCIDYVILHELCHLKYPNHSKEFYHLLSTVLPEWKIIKNRLETMNSH